MPITTIPGSSCTFKLGITAYSAQVSGYDYEKTHTVPRSKTLTDVAYTRTDTEASLSVDFLYDDETGLVGAIDAADAAGVAIELVVGDTKIASTAGHLTRFAVSVTAEGETTGSAAFIGTFAPIADVT